VPSDDLATVVSEAADAVRNRSDDLSRLSEVTADLPQRLLEVRTELESLIRTGPRVTDVLADNAPVLADDITRTAQLADILRDRRYDVLKLLRNGARFTTVAGDLIAAEKSNIACMLSDLGDINTTLATADNLADLAAVLDTNHFFFGGIAQIVQVGLDERTWFRVQLLLHQEPAARLYGSQRETPDVYPGNACRSRYGRGVGPATQPLPLHLAPDSRLRPGK
jgi:ABC-type transporter Mla subunit MlaD